MYRVSILTKDVTSAGAPQLPQSLFCVDYHQDHSFVVLVGDSNISSCSNGYSGTPLRPYAYLFSTATHTISYQFCTIYRFLREILHYIDCVLIFSLDINIFILKISGFAFRSYQDYIFEFKIQKTTGPMLRLFLMFFSL